MKNLIPKPIHPLKAFFIAFSLWVISILLKFISMGISWIFTPLYYLISLKWKTGSGKLTEWFFNMALSNDQSGNVQSAATFQVLFTKSGGEKFGNPDDTVSYVLAKNKYQNKLTIFGKALSKLLDRIDSSDGGHMKKSIYSKMESDQEGTMRLQQDKYFS